MHGSRKNLGRNPDFERDIADLQNSIEEEERLRYSTKVLEEAYHPKNVGRIANPDASAAVRGWCGDTMVIYLRLVRERIAEAKFMTDGCGPTVACGSMLTAMVHGIPLEEALRIEPPDLIAALDGLPEEHTHCATLAVNTLREALVNRQGKAED